MIFWKKNWWPLIFLSFLSVFYCHFYNKKKAAVNDLSCRLQEVKNQKSLALDTKEELRLSLYSQHDPDWIEIVLMRDLGVVPEGFLKVHFKK